MRHMLSILLENESGALSRVIGLFSQRGYNIETITVAPTEDPSVSKMTVQTVGDEQTIEQIEKQLHKLIDVLRVIHMQSSSFIEREILLIKIQVNHDTKNEIKNIVEIFKGKIIDITPTIYILQLSGTTKKIDSFINIIRSTSDIIETTRSGIIGISRESQLSNETIKKPKII